MEAHTTKEKQGNMLNSLSNMTKEILLTTLGSPRSL